MKGISELDFEVVRKFGRFFLFFMTGIFVKLNVKCY